MKKSIVEQSKMGTRALKEDNGEDDDDDDDNDNDDDDDDGDNSNNDEHGAMNCNGDDDHHLRVSSPKVCVVMSIYLWRRFVAIYRTVFFSHWFCIPFNMISISANILFF